MNDVETKLIGKTIKTAEVNGYGIYIEFNDGSTFHYEASDRGYSSYNVKEKG